MSPTRAPRTLLVIRGKLGDSLAAWPTIRAYCKRHPEEKIVVALRRNYVFLFAQEPDVELLPFSSTVELLIRTFWLRLSGKIDKLAVLWGFGRAIERLARWSGAAVRVYIDERFRHLFTVIAPATPNDFISDTAWRVAACLDPALPRPLALQIPSLRNRRKVGDPAAIGLVPVADEPRRVMAPETLPQLVAEARRRFPGAPVWLLGNPKDSALQPILAAGLPAGVELKPFPKLEQLVEALNGCRHLLTTDTGVYHLAASIGVPCTVFFGPTQPDKIVMPEQSDVEKFRLPHLGNSHCEVKDCQQPFCLNLAVDRWSNGNSPIPQRDHLPNGCLLIAKEGAGS